MGTVDLRSAGYLYVAVDPNTFDRIDNSHSQAVAVDIGRAVARGYVEIIRNTPLLVQVSIFYFVLQPILGINNPLWTGILCLAFFEGSFARDYSSKYKCGGQGQWEAARTIGLNKLKTYTNVVLPQAIPLMLHTNRNISQSCQTFRNPQLRRRV